MSGKQVIFKQLLEEHGLIQIPMIQRDFAQGRESQQEVRDLFVSALGDALDMAADDPKLPLNLDFIYGSVEGEGPDSKFAPLDGQQRLTTLFLLHWFLAWNENQWGAFEPLFMDGENSRFTYRVRPSSTEFFDFLVNFRPVEPPVKIESVSTLIRNQPGYFRSWRLDPTIQSTLVMLDSIRDQFVDSEGLFTRLTDAEQPAVTFQLLPLDKFGLSDDLYIKMNARGMPLTPFETFKARYEQELKKQFDGITRTIGDHEFPIHDFVSRRMDTAWMDLFWAENKGKRNRALDVDKSILNLFRVVALITRDPDSEECQSAIDAVTNFQPEYATFHKNGWLDEEFTLTLIPLLEAWCGDGGGFHELLTDSNYFDEKKVFSKLTTDSSSLEVSEILQFMGYVFYVRTHEGDLDPEAFQEWMRVVHNLVVNSMSIDRPERLPGGMKGLLALLPESASILECLENHDAATSVGTFDKWQLQEESLKAGLLLNNENWKSLIDRAELHGYFRGQIGFLLDYSQIVEMADEDAVANWDHETHEENQSCFEEYLNIAEKMFGSAGIVDPEREFLWQRALLSVGDYMFPMTAKRFSFLQDSSTEANSWRRLLRGHTDAEADGRQMLGELWDKLSDAEPIEDQLRQIVGDASELEPWRNALVKSASAMAYCKKRIIRHESENEIYLLEKMQMNGAHAELFTYQLFCDIFEGMESQGELAPLKPNYWESNDTYLKPGLQFHWTTTEPPVQFDVEWIGNGFLLFIGNDELKGHGDLSSRLIEKLGLVKAESRLEKEVATEGFVDEIANLRETLKSMASE